MNNIKHYEYDQEIFKEHVLKRYIGEGGYGRVYLVENRVGQAFALKVLFRDVQAEQRGVRAVMRIRSNRLVRLMDYGETVNGDFCVLMEYMDTCLSAVLATGTLAEPLACAYFLEILEGLRVLEKSAIIHRDIKPSNLFVLENIIKIGDFGTAKYTSGETLTKTKSAITTLRYSAPESFHNQHGFSADRWAAGVIFYRMLTGNFPFDGVNEAGLIGSIMMYEPDFAKVPEKYVPFLKKCFDKEKDNRFENVDDMAEAFGRAVSRKPPGTISQVKETAVPQKQATPPIPKYRSEPKTVARDNALREFNLEEHNGLWKPKTYVQNDFVDNGLTVFDRATGLLWQKSGSPGYITYDDAKKYVAKLNKEKFAGHDDWRLPTMDELITLLKEKKSSNDLYIDAIFDKKQQWCWTSDTESSGGAWGVNFYNGNVSWGAVSYKDYVRVVCPGQ